MSDRAFMGKKSLIALAGDWSFAHGSRAGARVAAVMLAALMAASAAAQDSPRPKIVVPALIEAASASQLKLDIQVEVTATIPRDSSIEIRGLPASVTLSEGKATGKGRWSVPVSSLDQLKLIVPSGATGRSDLILTLITSAYVVLAEEMSTLVIGSETRATAENKPQPGTPAKDAPSTIQTATAVAEKSEARPQPLAAASTGGASSETSQKQVAGQTVEPKPAEQASSTQPAEQAKPDQPKQAQESAQPQTAAIPATGPSSDTAAQHRESTSLAATDRQPQPAQEPERSASAVGPAAKAEAATTSGEGRAQATQDASSKPSTDTAQSAAAGASTQSSAATTSSERAAQTAQDAAPKPSSETAQSALAAGARTQSSRVTTPAEQTAQATQDATAKPSTGTAQSTAAGASTQSGTTDASLRPSVSSPAPEPAAKKEGDAAETRTKDQPQVVASAAPVAVPAEAAKEQPEAKTESDARQGPGAEARLQAERLLAQGERYLQQGNFVVARQYFLRAAKGGLAIAAFKLAETHDPHELARLNVQGMAPNPTEARIWYARAAELGVGEAEARLRRMGK